MSLARRIASNTLAMLIARSGQRFLSMAFVILVARKLGVEDFGRYSVVMSLATIFITFSNFGLQNLLVREIVRQPERANRFFFSVTALTTPASLAIWGVLIGVTYLLDYDRETTRAAHIVGLMLIPYSISFVLESFFQAMEQMRYISYVTLIAYTIQLGLGLGILLWKPGLLRIATVVLITEVVIATLYLYLGHHHLSVPGRWSHTEVDFRLSLRLTRDAISFILISTLSTVLLNSDVILLSKLQDEAAVGLYRAASRLVQLGSTLIFSYTMAIYPVMAGLQANCSSEMTLETLTAKSLRYLMVALLPIAVLGTALAQPLSRLVYGDQYAGMESALRILLWTLPFIAINQVLSRAIFARNRQQSIPWFLALGILVNLGLGFWWIPRWGYIATSWAILTVWVLVAVLTFWLALRCRAAGWDTLRAAIRPAICAALLGGFLLVFEGANFYLLLVIGASLYVGLLFLLQAFPQEDVALLRKIVRDGTLRVR